MRRATPARAHPGAPQVCLADRAATSIGQEQLDTELNTPPSSSRGSTGRYASSPSRREPTQRRPECGLSCARERLVADAEIR